MSKLRGLLLLPLLSACATEETVESYPPPSFVVDTWTYEALWNTDGATPGKEVNQGGILTLSKGSLQADQGDDNGENWSGKAKLVDSLYVVQGPVTDPRKDAQGEVLSEYAGTMTYEGVWRWENYESNDQLVLELQCANVEITNPRMDLPGIICGDPLPATIRPTCTVADGTGTLNCRFANSTNSILQKQ